MVEKADTLSKTAIDILTPLEKWFPDRDRGLSINLLYFTVTLYQDQITGKKTYNNGWLKQTINESL